MKHIFTALLVLSLLSPALPEEQIPTFTNKDLEAAHYNLGIAYKNLGMPKEAVASFKSAVSINPGSVDAHVGLGLTYMDLKDRASALEEYTVLKTLDPNQADILLKMIQQ